ncbi:MAG: Hpt domain-containing protein [bacterium]|nr:Hpt domain-containing protein [bacterium]
MLKILATEDRNTDRLVLEQFLRFVGQQACIATSLEEMSQCLKNDPFDLVLLSTDNEELFAMAQLQAQATLWVGLGSSLGPVITPEQGWFCYLPKPLDLEAFQDCIRAVNLELNERDQWVPGDLLDLRLIESRKEVDPDLVRSLINIFTEDAPIMIQQIKQMLEAEDFIELRDWAHKFRGMTGNVGAAAMSRLGQRIERAAEQSSSALIKDLTGHLEPILEQTNLEFDKLIIKLKP